MRGYGFGLILFLITALIAAYLTAQNLSSLNAVSVNVNVETETGAENIEEQARVMVNEYNNKMTVYDSGQ
ncbi:MAG: hypothetical protein Q4E57_05405 [Eubacteriales bacterium]|nr:hypothetical protein [Eubacteriales bacterium]